MTDRLYELAVDVARSAARTRRVVQIVAQGVVAVTVLFTFDWLYTEVPLLLAAILGAIGAWCCWRSYKNIPPIRGAGETAGPKTP